MQPKKFKVLARSYSHVPEIGTEIYQFSGATYGCVSDDECHTGREHAAFTLNQDGSGPFFTAAVADVEEIR